MFPHLPFIKAMDGMILILTRVLVQITSHLLRGRPLYLGKAMLQRIFQCFHICHSIKPFGWTDYSDSDKGPCTDYASEANHHSTWGKPPSASLAWPTSGLGSNQCSYVCLGHKTFKLAIGFFENLIYVPFFLAGSWTLEQSPLVDHIWQELGRPAGLQLV